MRPYAFESAEGKKIHIKAVWSACVFPLPTPWCGSPRPALNGKTLCDFCYLDVLKWAAMLSLSPPTLAKSDLILLFHYSLLWI